MKPIILVMNKDNKIEMTAERLQEIIDEAYEQGKIDGSLVGVCPTQPYPIVTWRGTYGDGGTSTGVKYTTESDAYLESLKNTYTSCVVGSDSIDSSKYPSNVTTTISM